MRRITCSFVALALDIHICLRAGSEGEIIFCMQRKRFEECAQNLTFHVGWAKAPLWPRLCILQNVGGSERVRSQKSLTAWRYKDWHGLHDLVTVISSCTQVPVTLRQVV